PRHPVDDLLPSGRYEVGQREPDEGPHLEIRALDEGDASRLGGEPGDADQGEGGEDPGVLGLGLGPDAPRRGDVTPPGRPRQSGQVDDAGEVEDERVALIEPAVEELEAGRKEMVDLEGDGAGEQDEEAVVDHGVQDRKSTRL